MTPKNLDLIVKTTFACNLRCSYCYEGYSPDTGIMSYATLDAMITKAGQFARDTGAAVKFIWHGGEPLLAGRSFYEYALTAQKAVGSDVKFINTIQTNGLLLDGGTADFLVGNNFKVGVSLDGPPVIHDAQRLAQGNKASFKEVFSALVELDKREASISALAVFTRNTLDHLDEF